MDILFVQMGGTIDKSYGGRKGISYNFTIDEPAYKRILGKMRLAFEPSFVTVARKDSTDLTDMHRKRLHSVCSKSTCNHIVVTHGSDTLLKTAAYLSDIEGKTIALTASFIPQLMKGTDADFHVGGAVIAVQVARPGIYVVMNGVCYDWRNCRHSRGIFVMKQRYLPLL